MGGKSPDFSLQNLKILLNLTVFEPEEWMRYKRPFTTLLLSKPVRDLANSPNLPCEYVN